MKILKSKYFRKDLRLLFLAFILTTIVSTCGFFLFYIYMEAEEKGMGTEEKEAEAEIFYLPYWATDSLWYLI